MTSHLIQEPRQAAQWREPLPKMDLTPATYNLPTELLIKIHQEVKEARQEGFNRTKSGLVAEALELYFSQKK